MFYGSGDDIRVAEHHHVTREGNFSRIQVQPVATRFRRRAQAHRQHIDERIQAEQRDNREERHVEHTEYLFSTRLFHTKS